MSQVEVSDDESATDSVTASSRRRMVIALMQFGYGRWQDIKAHARLKWDERTVRDRCMLHIAACLRSAPDLEKPFLETMFEYMSDAIALSATAEGQGMCASSAVD